ncbi:MAG: lytic transglycosylase domain-containing protein [Pseudomonadota bacterium]
MPADISATASQAPAVAAAIRRASEATGVGFDYLMRTAMRESSLNARAEAATSSAAGLFQFIEQTWLGAVKTHGAAHGLADAARDISKGPDGRFSVADPARRDAILDLRFDPAKAAALAGELARENARALEKSLGRAAGAADLYAAHFLGPAGAAKLLGAAAHQTAAALLPAAAETNTAVFYDGARARSVGEVIASFARSMGEAAPAPMTASSIAPALQSEAAPARKNAESAAPSPLKVEPARRPFAAGPGYSTAGALSALAISVLQAFDPLSVIGGREERRERS